MHLQVPKECELEWSQATNVVLAVQGNREHCLLRVFSIKFPPWRLAMDGVDKIWVTVACEGIGNDLAFCVLDLGTRGGRLESTFWSGVLHEPGHVVASEVCVDE